MTFRNAKKVRAAGGRPGFLETAEEMYGAAFEARTQKELAAVMGEWADLEEEEQRFTLAHLSYLNVQGQAAVVKSVMQVRELLEEIAEAMSGMLDWVEAQEPVEKEELPTLPIEVVEEARELSEPDQVIEKE